jgi:surface polysaccharide O-acyltransferase-like enzyme
MKRHYSVDVLRLIGAFAVIVIHIGFTRAPWEAQIRLLARFAVPFFFMVSGYFFEKKWKTEGDKAFVSTLLNLLSIYLVANLIYLPLNLGTAIMNGKEITLNLSNLLLGTWMHLWFMGAMIVGYLFMWVIFTHRLQKLLPYFSIAFFALMLLSEAYSFLGFRYNMELARTFLSIPLLYLGMQLSKYEVEKRGNLIFFFLLAVLGLAIHMGETLWLYFYHKVPIGKLQFYISTTFMATSFLCLSLKLEMPKPNWMSEWGRKYSLLIYLYHPLVLMWSPQYYAMIPKNMVFLKWMGPIWAFVLILIPILLIERYWPRGYAFLNGKLA